MPGDDYGSVVRPDGISTLRRYVDAVWRRKWVALVPLVAIPLVVFFAALRQDPLYEASAEVFVNRQEAATTSVIGQTPALDDAGRTMETQARLARVPAVAERTLEAAGLGNEPTALLLQNSSVFPSADLLQFFVRNEDGETAARLASEYARQHVRYQRELATAGLARTLDGLDRRIEQVAATGRTRSPLYLQLIGRREQLELLRELRVSNVSVVRTAAAGDAVQVAPRPKRDLALGVGAGLVVGLVLVVLWEMLSTRPRSDDELEALLGMPLLARLPAPGEAGGGPVGDDADALQTLRTGLELARERVGARRVMVTSARRDAGKRRTMLPLAQALARSGRHVVLVDADLRRSRLSVALGLEDRFGLANVAAGECELEDAIAAVSLDDGTGGSQPGSGRPPSRDGTLEVVGAGRTTAHPAELLSSNGLASIFEQLNERADVVLLDAPPALEVPDAAAVAPRVDAVLLLVDLPDALGPVLADTRGVVDGWPVSQLGFAIVEGGASPTRPVRLGSAAPSGAPEKERVA